MHAIADLTDASGREGGSVEFRAEPFNSEKHYPLYAGWAKARGACAIPQVLLPVNGYAVSLGSHLLCMGFLYRTDGGIAMLGSFMSDPAADRELRSHAVDFLTVALESLARVFGHLLIGVLASGDSHKSRCARLGFQHSDKDLSFYIKEVV